MPRVCSGSDAMTTGNILFRFAFMNVFHGSVLILISSLFQQVEKMTIALRDTINEYFRYLFAKPTIAKQFALLDNALEQTK